MTDSKAKTRILQYKLLRDHKEKGILNGIPLWDAFPKFSDWIPSIDKQQVSMICAYSGVGKSQFGRFYSIIAPCMYVLKHPELEIDLKILVFLLEDDESKFQDYIISFILGLKYSIYLSPKHLTSSFKESLDDDTLMKIAKCTDIADKIFNMCIVYDSIYNSFGIYKTCRLHSEKWGTHYYSLILPDKTEKKITKEEYNKLKKLPAEYKNSSLQELKEVGINPYVYKDFWKYCEYIPNNPKQHVICYVDNINCLDPDKNELTLKNAIDNFMYKYCRRNIAKHWKWSVVAIQQFVGGNEANQYDYKGDIVLSKTLPNLSDLGDSKLSQRACHVIIGLYDPWRYGITEFMDYDVEAIKDSIRFIFLLKNNDGYTNKVKGLLFFGECSYFKELPVPEKITKEIIDRINNRNFKITI